MTTKQHENWILIVGWIMELPRPLWKWNSSVLTSDNKEKRSCEVWYNDDCFNCTLANNVVVVQHNCTTHNSLQKLKKIVHIYTLTHKNRLIHNYVYIYAKTGSSLPLMMASKSILTASFWWSGIISKRFIQNLACLGALQSQSMRLVRLGSTVCVIPLYQWTWRRSFFDQSTLACL